MNPTIDQIRESTPHTFHTAKILDADNHVISNGQVSLTGTDGGIFLTLPQKLPENAECRVAKILIGTYPPFEVARFYWHGDDCQHYVFRVSEIQNPKNI